MKEFKGEYDKGERIKGTEYYENGLVKLEGEYLNGKLWNIKGYNIDGNFEFEIESGNGIIKEYDYNGTILFEGEYLDGERNGKGKEYGNLTDEIYNINKDLEYEILKGKGVIKEYDYYGKLIYEGEYINGEKNGKGKEYDYNGKLIFEGEYIKGERNGKGKEYIDNCYFILKIKFF